MRKITIIIPIIVVLLMVTACSKDITVKLIDSGIETAIETKTETDISDVLKQNNINIGEKDVVVPSLDSMVTEEISEIVIKRYAKVTIIKGLEQETLELVGATVKEAIEKSKFKIEEGEETDKDLDSYLTDGMEIHILKEILVNLTIDGDSEDIKTKAVTVSEFLNEQNVSLGEDDEINEDMDSALKDGMKINVKRIEYKEEARKETIEYSTEERNSNSMYKGESEVTQEGANGEKEVIYKVKYIDGKEDSKEKLSETVIKEPTTKIITNGTKAKMLTPEEAQEIAWDYWNVDSLRSNGTYYGVFVNESPTTVSGLLYYQCYLKYRHDGIYSTVDYLFVNAQTGDCKTMG